MGSGAASLYANKLLGPSARVYCGDILYTAGSDGNSVLAQQDCDIRSNPATQIPPPQSFWIYNLPPVFVKSEMPQTHEITELLQAWSSGDSEALARLIPLVDRELKNIASAYLRRERPGHILQTTALVDEALIRLINAETISWDNRKHFYALIARRMRQVLIDDARRQITAGGTRLAHVQLTEAEKLADKTSEELLILHEALIKLEKLDERKARVVELRHFGGFTYEEVAKILGVSRIYR